MVEGSFKSFDPLAYYVNRVDDFDKQIVKAHKDKDTATINRLLGEGAFLDLNVFICVNHDYHAFLLLDSQPTDEDREAFLYTDDLCPDDPFKIPDMALVWKIELRFDNVRMRTYKITRKFCQFKDVRESIRTPYWIGKYKHVNVKALQFSALRAAPMHYNALIADCVEFGKEFCLCLLSYCSNGLQLDKDVQSRIERASATGLSIERLSRQSDSSGLLGNTLLGGVDMSSFFGSRHRIVVGVLILFILLIYPIIVALVVVYFWQTPRN